LIETNKHIFKKKFAIILVFPYQTL